MANVSDHVMAGGAPAASMRAKLSGPASALMMSPAERAQPFAIRVRLTRLLFSRFSDVFLVGAAGLLTGIYAEARDQAWPIFLAAAAGFAMIVLRCGLIRAFQQRLAQGRRFDPEAWIAGFGLTACASSVCWGALSFASLAYSHDPVLYLAAVVFNTATSGAVAARCAAAPRVAHGQLLLGLTPVMAGALLADDSGYRFLDLAVPALILGLFSVVAEIHKQLVELYASQLKLLSLSNTDHLTQIPNRRYFGECCEDVLAARRASLRPLTILMVDVDYFKDYNDCYGHQAGDFCLRQIAQLLQAGLRNTDSVVSRYGGEEFAVLLRDTGVEAGAAIAQRLCDAVAAAAMPHGNRRDKLEIVTVSVGAASAEGIQVDCELLIEAADQALYRAKTQGRNRICAEFK